ncbi:MAG TPA: HAD hydrolase family protein [bacterium]|nr:HAD hydrolase family protein [bacterium]
MKKTRPDPKRIRLFLTDVDGCLTDGKIYVGKGLELMGFDIQDGIGHRLAEVGGLEVGWLSGRHSEATAERAGKLRVAHVYLGVLDKLKKAQAHCGERGLALRQVAYLGDDLIDLPLMAQVGWAVAPVNARPEVKRAAHAVTRAAGGAGAFREAVETLLKAQGRWTEAVRKFHARNAAPPDGLRLD